MKTITLTIVLLVATLTGYASDSTSIGERDAEQKKTKAKTALTQQINQHLFYPVQKNERIEGSADVELEVLASGKVKLTRISTNNSAVKNFVEAQVGKMKMKKDSVLIGAKFTYRLVFKKQA